MYSILFINLFIFYRLYYLYRTRKYCGQFPKKNKYFIGAGLSVILSIVLFLFVGDYMVIPGFIFVLVFTWLERKTVKKTSKKGRKSNE